MALLPTVKFAVSVAFLLASLCGLKHAGLLGPEKLGPLQDRLMGLPGQHSKCQACLEGGQDCYFDKECHAKVDWEKISKIKGGFFERLKMYKVKDDASAVKQLWIKVHDIVREAGMPGECIDYILAPWVKSVFQRLNKDKGDVALKDCFFDKECHEKVDWKKISEFKVGFFKRLKKCEAEDDASDWSRLVPIGPDCVRLMLVTAKELFQRAGMPDDRIDYTLVKWVKHMIEM